ncbi:MAG: dTMP kinase [Deltaproteobacteria bacterium CG23_combo_of_CG06-09_8_20_14_all_60_8]|nr:MAG: dTMP kinase [Desulfobacterales bacterium CG2_30_60_27]PIP44535.1 MAG: dTMP kinase [Deltaproteobacteria bacterium CG23_combo_of_CG06-09_8_20_14_all_60_8]
MKPSTPPPSNAPGLLIAFEGIDGTGKSSQIRLLAATLRGQGVAVVATREPTDGEYGRRIRALYVQRDTVSREEELALFVADRRQHVAQVIMPALAAARVVLTDRYYYSTAAYQGANGLDFEDILRQNEAFAPRPDLVLLLRIPVAEGLRRIRMNRGESPDTFEGEDYLARVVAVYDRLAGANIVRIDGLGSVDEVQARVLAAVRPLLAGRGPGV